MDNHRTSQDLCNDIIVTVTILGGCATFFVMAPWKPRLASRSGPRYLAIADALADDVASQRLKPGDRLPTHRELADTLGVTVGTVSRAYAVAIERGLVNGEVGRGSFVRAAAEVPAPAAAVEFRDPSDRSVIDLGLSFLRVPEHDHRIALALQSLAATPDLASLFDEYKPQSGLLRHRESAVRWIARSGLSTTRERVLVCAGAQHALTVAVLGLSRPGDTIVADEVTYPAMIALARALGRNMRAIELDDDGMVPEALDEACRAPRARIIYCMPSLQNPTARVMSSARRERIAEVAARHNVAVIEDDVYGFLAEPALPAVSALVPELGHLVCACTKSVAPGLRVGFLAVPPGAAARFHEPLWATAVMAAPPMVEVASRWIEDGTAELMASARRDEARIRQTIARRILGDAARGGDAGAFHLWLPLPAGRTSAGFVAAAAQRCVAVIPGEAFAVGELRRNAVRISLGPPRDHDELSRGLRVIADLLAGLDAAGVV